MFCKSKKNRASTLLEILLYFVIFGIFLTAALSFAIQIIHVTQLSSGLHELESTGQFLTERINAAIQSADSIDEVNSVFDEAQGVLSLNTTEPTESPAIFSLADGVLSLKEGLGEVIQLHSSWVSVDSFEIHRVEANKVPDLLIIDMILSVPSDLANTGSHLPIHLTISLRP